MEIMYKFVHKLVWAILEKGGDMLELKLENQKPHYIKFLMPKWPMHLTKLLGSSLITGRISTSTTQPIFLLFHLFPNLRIWIHINLSLIIAIKSNTILYTYFTFADMTCFK
jgi:hypothetical protein